MNFSREFLEIVENQNKERVISRSENELSRLSLDLLIKEINYYIQEISSTIKDEEVDSQIANLENTINSIENQAKLCASYSQEIESGSEPELDLRTLEELVKDTSKKFQLPISLITEVESLLAQLDCQSSDSVKKIKHEIESGKEKELMPYMLNDLQKSMNVNKENLRKLLERNITIMALYNEKLAEYEMNISKLENIQKQLAERNQTLNQNQAIERMVIEEELSWRYHISAIKKNSQQLKITNPLEIKHPSIQSNNNCNKTSSASDSIIDLGKEIKLLRKRVENSECLYEDRIAGFYKTEKAAKANVLIPQIKEKLALMPFLAIFHQIVKNRSKRRLKDNDILLWVNEELMKMSVLVESNTFLP